jgi:pimeloyl-ACP methyl ester carboxylesterase
MPLAQALNETTQMTDAKAFIGWLDQQPSVAKNRKMGTQGYCMGGPIAFRTAAAVPDRVGAVGSFHGGGLVTTNPNSPHLQAAKTKAQFLIAIAANDDQRAPTDKTVLKETFEKANLPARFGRLQRAAGREGLEPSARAVRKSPGLRSFSNRRLKGQEIPSLGKRSSLDLLASCYEITCRVVQRLVAVQPTPVAFPQPG